MSEPAVPQSLVTRQQVIEAYQPFISAGITSPYNLDLDNSDVMAARRIHDAWRLPLEAMINTTPPSALTLEVNLELTTLYVDAGFQDESYVLRILNWLEGYLLDARESGYAAVAEKIEARLTTLRNLAPAR